MIDDWISAWWRPLLAAPQQLDQPILPGWTVGPVVTINAGNSSAPQTEAEVVQRHSYGRQLGRISDALEVLICERDARAHPDPRLTDFLTMVREIDEVKGRLVERRRRQLREDLAALKAASPEEFRQLLDGLDE